MTRRGHERRRRVLLALLLLAAASVLGRSFQVQVVQGARWEARAEDQHRQRLELPAPRGVIYDRAGVPLASSREALRVAVAPRELADADAAAVRLGRVLGLSSSRARRAVDPADRWMVLPGLYGPEVQSRLAGLPGIYFERVLERVYPHGELARELIGRVSPGGRAAGGVELAMDSLLKGRPGTAVVRRNAGGEPIPGAMLTVVAPEPGHDIHLTIDHHLQEIADEALRAAIRETGADGGDLLLTDPRTGELLAAVSRRGGEARHWWSAIEPYEPGSTLKAFTVAALLAEGRAALGDSVYAEEGRYDDGGRTIRDVHGYGWLTLRGALTVSSNIAMAKMAERLERGEQYRYLRDFGFGTPTGVTYPAESSGLLRRPDAWSAYSQASLAIGYEIAVTPLQMVMAYGALANDGVLMAPRLVRRIRSRDGREAWDVAPRRIRRVVSPGVARGIRTTLIEAVERGTGTRAALGGFRVAGKTGTARRAGENGYAGNGHTASFAGFFPASDPQLAFLVKLDRPQGQYYGGVAAAPVTRRLLEAALAARAMPLDRSRIAAVLRPPAGAADASDALRLRASLVPALASADGELATGGPAGSVPAATPATGSGAGAAVRSGVAVRSDAAVGADAAAGAGPYIFALDTGPPRRYRRDGERLRRRVPDVRGLPLRDAAQHLHGDGFRVRLDGSGPAESTLPAAGTEAPPGAVVLVRGAVRAAQDARAGRPPADGREAPGG